MATIGNKVGEVTLKLGYQIIRHFSEHLYKSPNKAIEELVVNGYDAGASCVKVWLSDVFCKDCLVIWDDGASMDIGGLQKLWEIADSPKKDDETRTIIGHDGRPRKVIGKFGIGKLASYSLGEQITHLCKKNGKIIYVTVDFERLLDTSRKNVDENGVEVIDPVIEQIMEVTDDEAKAILTDYFINLPDGFDALLDRPTWTVAVASKTKPHKITYGRLNWVLSASMPLSLGFRLMLNDKEVRPNLEKSGIEVAWDFGEAEVKKALEASWKTEVDKGELTGDLVFGKEPRLDPWLGEEEETPFVVFPNLGKVWGLLRLYGKSLLSQKGEDDGDQHGFFIFVRNRLVNEEDKKLFLNDPSFQTFYSSQYLLHCDGLDGKLSADREGFSKNNPAVAELEFLQKNVYKLLQRKQNDNLNSKTPSFKIPNYSSSAYFEPLGALYLMRNEDVKMDFDVRNPPSLHKPLGEAAPFCRVEFDKGVVFNEDHPLRRRISKSYGGQKGRAVLSEIEQLAFSDTLLDGYMFSIGVAEDHRAKIALWKEEFYRALAENDPREDAKLIEKLNQSSHLGDKAFEKAICNVLNALGFVATMDGASGKKDGYIVAHCGDESYVLTFEAKGKAEGPVPNDAAEISAADAHRKDAKAEHAVVVAREFAGFSRERAGEVPAVLNECVTSGRVSIMTTEHLADLLLAFRDYVYSLDTLKSVFTTIEPPSEKSDRIRKLREPTESFDYQKLLEIIHSKQINVGRGRFTSVLTVWQEHYQDELGEEDFYARLEALRMLAFPLVQYGSGKIGLKQSPENVLQRMTKQLGITT